MKRTFFVTGIGTGVGKTVVSSALVELYGADYWKPVQAGLDETTDTEQVRSLTTGGGIFHRERYRLSQPLSPHSAAAIDSVTITLNDFTLPATGNTLVIEGAGGLMVPLNDRDLILDLIAHLNVPVVLVSRHYLGSINHTLLSLQVLKQRAVPVSGIVFVGDAHPMSEQAILARTDVPCLGRIPLFSVLDRKAIAEAARLLEKGMAL